MRAGNANVETSSRSRYVHWQYGQGDLPEAIQDKQLPLIPSHTDLVNRIVHKSHLRIEYRINVLSAEKVTFVHRHLVGLIFHILFDVLYRRGFVLGSGHDVWYMTSEIKDVRRDVIDRKQKEESWHATYS